MCVCRLEMELGPHTGSTNALPLSRIRARNSLLHPYLGTTQMALERLVLCGTHGDEKLTRAAFVFPLHILRVFPLRDTMERDSTKSQEEVLPV